MFKGEDKMIQPIDSFTSKKEMKFVEYLITQKVTVGDAFKMAYPKKASKLSRQECTREGAKLKRNPRVIYEIDALQKDIAKQCQIDPLWVLQQYKKIVTQSLVLEDVYTKEGIKTGNKKLSDATNARGALSDINKMLGYNAVQKAEVSVEVDLSSWLVNMSDEKEEVTDVEVIGQ